MTFKSRTLKAVLEHNIEAHKLCAYMICLMTYSHLISHCFNIMLLTDSHNTSDGLISALNLLIDDGTNSSYLNPIRSEKVNYIKSVFQLFGGWTGIVITLSLILIVTSAQEPIRRSFFEVFWVTHHLFVVFFAFLIIHGLGWFPYIFFVYI